MIVHSWQCSRRYSPGLGLEDQLENLGLDLYLAEGDLNPVVDKVDAIV